MWSFYQEFPESPNESPSSSSYQIEAFSNDAGEITEYRKVFKKNIDRPSAAGDWDGKVHWAIDFGDQLKPGKDTERTFARLVVRKEDFGAIILDPETDRVFKVNKPGLELINQLQDAIKTTGSHANLMAHGKFNQEAVSHFLELLKVSGLLSDKEHGN
jgi:hypothetical protein